MTINVYCARADADFRKTHFHCNQDAVGVSRRSVAVFHRPLINGEGLGIFEKLALPFSKMEGGTLISEKNAGANFFGKSVHAGLGFFCGCFPLSISKNPQNFLRSRLQRSRVTSIPLWQGRAQKQRIREPVRLVLCSFGPSTAALAAFRALICARDGSTTHTLCFRAARPCKSAYETMYFWQIMNLRWFNYCDFELFNE